MNAKAILGLLALGAAALSLRGRRRRSVSGLGGQRITSTRLILSGRRIRKEVERLAPIRALPARYKEDAVREEVRARLERWVQEALPDIDLDTTIPDGYDYAVGARNEFDMWLLRTAEGVVRDTSKRLPPLDEAVDDGRSLVQRAMTEAEAKQKPRSILLTSEMRSSGATNVRWATPKVKGRRTGKLGGLGSSADTHFVRFKARLEMAEQALLQADMAIVDARAARLGRAKDEHGVSRQMLSPADIRYHLNVKCSVAAANLIEASRNAGMAQSDRMGMTPPPENFDYDAINEGREARARVNEVGGLLRDINVARQDYEAACHVRKPQEALRGLGLDPAQHGTNRSTLSTAAGFRVRDARRAARNGWCESAFTLLRDAEYHAGQVTAHAKSIPGRDGEGQRRKAQALRVAVNRLARDIKQGCSIHRRRPPAGSRKQGKLPF